MICLSRDVIVTQFSGLALIGSLALCCWVKYKEQSIEEITMLAILASIKSDHDTALVARGIVFDKSISCTHRYWPMIMLGTLRLSQDYNN